jgi:C-terminal processing protease CtpA/Prc
MIKDLPQVKTIGQITGGGGGGNSSFYLPNGWVVTMSVNKFLDANAQEVEEGILPEIEIINDSLDLVNLTDKMLERAIEEF